MKKGKRILSLFLALAMVITGVNLGGLTPVEAKETKSETYYQVITGMSYGCQVTNNGATRTNNGNCKDGKGQVTLKSADSGETVSTTNTKGNAAQAPFTSASVDTSTNGGDLGECGGHRNACIVFDMSEKAEMDLTNLKSAKVSLNITSVSNTKKEYSSKWFRVALYETANSKTVTSTDESTYAALEYRAAGTNGENDPGSAIWSDKTISDSSANGGNGEVKGTGTITFDVTEAFKKAYKKGDRNIVYRVQVPRGGISFDTIRLTIDATTETKTTIKYVDETGAELDSKQVNVSVASQYTYDVLEDEKIIQKDGCIYVYKETASSPITVTSDTAQNVITLTYTKVVPVSVEDPATIYTIKGNEPILPKQLVAQTNTGTEITVDVEWPDTIMVGETETALKDLNAGSYSVTGKVGTIDATAELQVLECDEVVETIEAGNGNPVPTYKLGKAYKGTIVTEFDMEVAKVTDINSNDQSVIYTDDTQNRANWVESSGVRIDFGGSGSDTANTPFFRSQQGNGAGGRKGWYPNEGGKYQDADGYVKAEAGKTYRFRIEIDASTQGGNYKTYITEENGKITKLFEDNGNQFRGWKGDGIQNFMAVRGGFTITNHKISWTSGWSKYTINTFVDGMHVDTETSEKEIAGTDHSSYKPAKIYTSEGKKAFLNEEKSGWEDGKSAAGDKETIVYNARYETSEIASQGKPIELKSRVGYIPELPETAMAKYANNELQEEEVEWDAIDPSNYAQEGTYTATGKFKGTEIAVEATVTVVSLASFRVAEYNFDENLSDSFGNHAEATKEGTVTYTNGLDGKAASLPGGANAGYIILPDTLTTADDDNNNQIPDDFTLSFFTKRGANGETYAFSLGTKLENGTKPGPTEFFGLTNRDGQFQAEFKKNGTDAVTVAKGAATPQDEWVHIAVVAKGSTGEAWLYENGTLVKYADNVTLKMSDLTGGKNYIGYSPYTAKYSNPNYKGDVDKFAIYGTDLTAAEIKDICDETLYKLQIKKTKDVLQKMIAEGEFVDEDGEKINKDAVTKNIVLPETLDDEEAGIGTKITWKSSNDDYVANDGEVNQPSKDEGDKTITLTPTIEAGGITETLEGLTITVKEGDELNFKGLKNAIDKAQAQYDAAQAKNIYSAASMGKLKEKIDAANVIAAYGEDGETIPADVTYDTINNARKALTDALNALKLKDLAELDETALTAHYSLDEIIDQAGTKKVKDSSKNGHDGTVHGNVTATEANGASFPSGGALRDYISLPTDMTVTDQTTISFWMKAGEETTRNILGLGSIFGDKGGSSKHFYLSSAMNVFMTNNGWASGAHKGFQDVAFTKLAWHQVTAILEGKTLTLYIDGQKIGTKDTDISMKDAWDAQGGTKYAYIGNSAYGQNGDKDFKGNIRDVRIYAASLEEAQVEEVYSYMTDEYKKHLAEAKAGIVTSLLGAEAEAGEDGAYSYSVPASLTSISFPAVEDEWVSSVKWASNDNAINAETGAITLVDAAKNVRLTATLTAGNQTEELVIICSLPKKPADKTALQQAIDLVDTKNEADYTADSWAAMQAKLKEAQDVMKDDEALASAVAQKAKELTDAINALVPKTKEALNTAIKNAENFIKDETGSKSEYPADRWTALESALADAKEVYAKADATESQISTATGALTEAQNAMKKTSVIEQETAKAELGTSLTTAQTDVQELGVTAENAAELASTKVWNDYSEALTAAQALGETASTAELRTAKTNLNNALAELKETVQAKADLKTAIADASGLTEADFANDEDWEAYQSALSAANAAVEDEGGEATSSSLKAALDDLNAALQAKSPRPVTLSLNPTALSLKEGATATITANVTPTGTTVEWSSDKKSIATVDQKGNVKAVKAGTATITATAGDKTATCKVKVIVPVTKVKITESLAGGTKPAVAIGKKITLKAAITPSNASNRDVTWSIDKKFAKYASISSKGVFSAKKAGAGKTVTVTATAKDGSKRKATIKVKIMKNAVTKVSLKAGKKKVKAGKKITVKATVKTNGKKASKTLAWSIDKKSAKYASINSKGVLSTKKTGKGKTVTVTATATDGTKKKATIKIKITK